MRQFTYIYNRSYVLVSQEEIDFIKSKNPDIVILTKNDKTYITGIEFINSYCNDLVAGVTYSESDNKAICTLNRYITSEDIEVLNTINLCTFSINAISNMITFVEHL